MSKISVAVLTYNEEKNIKECLESVREMADEIVLVDERSTDRTVEIAKKYTSSITLVDHGTTAGRTHDTMFHKHKQLAIEKCRGDWIFQIDADEKVTPELVREIKKTVEAPFANGYKVPRKNKIFGKYLEHTGWYPDYQIKLFKKGKGRYPCKSVHEQIEIDGEIGTLKNDLLHDHYKSVEQFIDRMNRYTSNDVEFMIAKGEGSVVWADAIKFPLDEFLKRFFYWEGYKDGLHGLVLSLLKAADREIVFAKLWEKQGFTETADKNFLQAFYFQLKKSAKDFKYWQLYVEQNPVKKLLGKII